MPGGQPHKVGVGIADIMTGMYAAVSILAALRHRDNTGEGQQIDMALLDTQVSWLANEGLNYLVSGKVPKRQGNAHPNIVPYEVFECADGFVILAVGNDGQFRKLCEFAGHGALADDPRFATNPQRVANRKEIVRLVNEFMRTKPQAHWVEGLAKAGVPCSPVNDIGQVFEDPQVVARGMKITMPHAAGVDVPLIASPIKMSKTPPRYRHAPPICGQHTDEVLAELLGIDADERAALRSRRNRLNLLLTPDFGGPILLVAGVIAMVAALLLRGGLSRIVGIAAAVLLAGGVWATAVLVFREVSR